MVIKALDNAIQHKTEVGAVKLGINSPELMQDALDEIDKIKEFNSGTYLVEKMASSGLELIIGGINDSSFGPVLMLGTGGVVAEAIKDVVMRLAPVSNNEAQQMISELRCTELLNGWRGAPAIDKEKLATVLVNLSHLLATHQEITEMDINPVRLDGENIIALDALIELT